MFVAFLEEDCRLIEVAASLCDLTQDGQGAADAAVIPTPPATLQEISGYSLCTLCLPPTQQYLSECIQS